VADKGPFLIIWAVILALAYPYVQRAKHPDAKPLAAYLIFVTVLSTATVVLFFALGQLFQAAGWAGLLAHTAFAPVLLVLVFGPAFLLARWVLRLPPRRPPKLDQGATHRQSKRTATRENQ